MASATFIRTISVGQKSTALVEIDGVEVIVEFWYELLEQWGKEDVKTYLCAEALKQIGYLTDAHELLKPDAVGLLTETKDSRNWQQNWIDSYPIQNAPIEVDPLL